MNTFTTTWGCIALANAVVVVGAFYMLLWLARRELTGHEAPPGLAGLLRALAARVERLIDQPPTWRAVWTHPKVRVVATGLPVSAVVAVSGWVLWSHAGTWFASAPPPPLHHTSSGLPYEAAFDHLLSALVAAFRVLSLLSLFAGALCAAYGEGRRGMAVLVAGVALCGASIMISAVSSLADRTDALEVSQVESESTEPARVPPATATSAAPSGSVEHQDSHIGVGDALMLYGAYRLLNSDHSEQDRARGARPAGEVSKAPAYEPNHAQWTQVPHPAAAPIYTRHEGPVSAIRTRAGTARAASFRRGR